MKFGSFIHIIWFLILILIYANNIYRILVVSIFNGFIRSVP